MGSWDVLSICSTKPLSDARVTLPMVAPHSVVDVRCCLLRHASQTRDTGYTANSVHIFFFFFLFRSEQTNKTWTTLLQPDTTAKRSPRQLNAGEGKPAFVSSEVITYSILKIYFKLPTHPTLSDPLTNITHLCMRTTCALRRERS